MGTAGAVGDFDVHHISSWADVHRDISAWLENSMQVQAFEEMKKLEAAMRKSRNARVLDAWRKLQTSDHFYYMCTKWFADGDVHKYFNCYETPYDAFMNYMNVMADIKNRAGLRASLPSRRPSGSSRRVSPNPPA